jgi:ankyrin repeat protein
MSSFAGAITGSDKKESLFLTAVETGNLEAAKSFLNEDPCLVNINDTRKKGDNIPVLLLAIQNKHPEIVKLLLLNGADVNCKNISGELGSLHTAASLGCSDIIPVLIKFGADPNGKRGNFKFPPLCYAETADAAETLIYSGADVRLRNENGITPLHLLAAHGKIQAAEVLLKYGAEIDANDRWGKTPLHYASEYGQAETVDFLLKKGASINTRDELKRTALNWADNDTVFGEKKSRKKCAELLISRGADYTISDVVWLGDSVKVKQLLKNNPALAEPAVLRIAVEEEQTDMTQYLIDSGADINSSQFKTPLLHIAANKGCIDVIKLLTRNGASVNQRGEFGELALHWAAAKGYTDTVKFLLDSGSEINVAAKKQRGDMDVFISEEINPVEEKLKSLEQTAAQIRAERAGSGLQIMMLPGVVFAAGDTPLFSATQRGHTQIAKLLIASGADVNYKNKFGDSPLHYACVFRHKETVQLLIDSNADINAVDNNGHSPLLLASSPADLKDEKIIEMLAKRGAK